MSPVRRLLVAAPAAAALAAVGVAPAVTASSAKALSRIQAHSASVSGCQADSWDGATVRTCAYINGAGQNVRYMNMHACVYGSRGVWLNEAIYAPNGGPSIRSRAW